MATFTAAEKARVLDGLRGKQKYDTMIALLRGKGSGTTAAESVEAVRAHYSDALKQLVREVNPATSETTVAARCHDIMGAAFPGSNRTRRRGRRSKKASASAGVAAPAPAAAKNSKSTGTKPTGRARGTGARASAGTSARPTAGGTGEANSDDDDDDEYFSDNEPMPDAFNWDGLDANDDDDASISGYTSNGAGGRVYVPSGAYYDTSDGYVRCRMCDVAVVMSEFACSCYFRD